MIVKKPDLLSSKDLLGFSLVEDTFSDIILFYCRTILDLNIVSSHDLMENIRNLN